jgi:predicted AAA+ superfamily ATPase
MTEASARVPAYLPRHAEASIARALSSIPIVILDGPRGVGKTTTARRYAKSILSFPADLDRLAVDAAGTLHALPTPVLIDEWQLAGPDLLWVLKGLVDADPRPGRFLLTGSVEPATYGPTYPLTGRAATVSLRPFTVAEHEGVGDRPTFVERFVAGESMAPTAGRTGTLPMGEMLRSGFPGARRMEDQRLFLEGYASLLAQRAGDEGRDATRMLRSLRILATLEGQAVPDQRIWEAADINKLTWKNYEDLLARTHISVPLPAYESNRLARLTTYPKRFLADVALALNLAQVDRAQLTGDPSLAGRYFESFVLQQLRPQVDAVRGTISHIRLGSGSREVDAVAEVGQKLLAFEAKSSTKATAADAKQLAWLRDQQGDRFGGGFVAYAGGDLFALGDRLWALPVSALTG